MLNIKQTSQVEAPLEDTAAEVAVSVEQVKLRSKMREPIERSAPSARGTHTLACRFVLCVAVLLIGHGVLAEEASASDNPSSARTLEGLVSELLQLELEESKEKTAWREQGGQLDTMIALLKAEKERLKKAIEGFKAEEKTEQTERERVAHRISKMKTALLEVAHSASDAGRDILAEYGKLPAPLQEQLKTGAQLVRTRLDEQASAENAVERLRTVVAFSHDMQRILSEVHAVKEVIAFEEQQRLEVDVLYLGGTIGFYLTPDRKQAGVLRRSGGQWTRESHDEIAPQVALALEVKRKETPPTLVALPLDPPEARAHEKKKKKEENDE